MWQHMFSVPVVRAVWRRELMPPHSTHYRQGNNEIPEDDLIGDRNMLDYFLKVFK